MKSTIHPKADEGYTFPCLMELWEHVEQNEYKASGMVVLMTQSKQGVVVHRPSPGYNNHPIGYWSIDWNLNFEPNGEAFYWKPFTGTVTLEN